MTIGSLFSGIGGLELGLERAGLGPVLWQVEIDPFCRSVLKKHWPDVERFEDVTKIETLPPVDLICGGFPCQDISYSGLGAGIDGDRSGLWDEFSRILGELLPRFVVVENVPALLGRGISRVLGDLSRLRYDAWWSTLSACALGAPHTRNRVFVVAHAQGVNGAQRVGNGSGGGRTVQPSHHCKSQSPEWLVPFSGVRGVAAGIPDRVDRLRALGNAVVPQCAEVIGWVIRELQA